MLESLKNCNSFLNFSICYISNFGHHIVRVCTCKKTETVDVVGREHITSSQSSSTVPKPLTNRVCDLEISTDKITMGQGEYVVFHRLSTGERKSLSEKTFDKVYEVLQGYSITVLAKRKAFNNLSNRYELIKSELKKIDPSLQIVFIPKTLYELTFIRQCIQEDLDHEDICPFSDFETNKRLQGVKRIAIQNERGCWHLCDCVFEYTEEEKNCDSIKKITFRMFEAFNSITDDGLTYKELLSLTEKEIGFLKNYCTTFNLETFQASYEKNFNLYKSNTSLPKPVALCDELTTPSLSFGLPFALHVRNRMGISSESSEQIIRNAIALECSNIAKHSLFLFRGSCFQNDSIGECCSLSYGSSLFAGGMCDGGATAFRYMSDPNNDAYAIPVRFDQLDNSLFFVPTSTTVAQLFGKGELFHPRTKVCKQGSTPHLIRGLLGFNGRVTESLKSDSDKNNLIRLFREYKTTAIQMK